MEGRARARNGEYNESESKRASFEDGGGRKMVPFARFLYLIPFKVVLYHNRYDLHSPQYKQV